MMTQLPLHSGINKILLDKEKLKNNIAHPGLFFDKFVEWDINFDASPVEVTLASGCKKDFYKKTISHVEAIRNTLNDFLLKAVKRRETFINAQQGEFLKAKTSWRMVSGLGAGHPLETGLIWHRTLGVPYLPGSSVKGIMRALLEKWEEPVDKDKVIRLFGGEENGVGNLIIFDAIPTECPKLDLDIMNPHYTEYYESSGGKPPADYYSPRPIFFIAVAPKQEFEFAIGHRRPNAANAASEVKEGINLLKDALELLGAGGKTAAGYGQFSFNGESAENLPQFTWEGVRLTWEPGNQLLTAHKNNTDKASAEKEKAKEIIKKLPDDMYLKLTGKSKNKPAPTENDEKSNSPKKKKKRSKKKPIEIKKISVEEVGGAFIINEIMEI